MNLSGIVGFTRGNISMIYESKNYIGVIKKMSGGFLSAFLIFSLGGCLQEKNNSGTLLPATCNTLPTSEISYQKNVYPIIQASCLTCHDARNHFGGIVLENYNHIAESGQSGELMYSLRIISSGKAYMPKGGRLMDCEVAILQAWIQQGSKNN